MISRYTNETKRKIENYILNERGIDKYKIHEIVNKQRIKKTKNSCPRCGTLKIRTDKVKWNIPLFEAGLEDEYAMLHEIKTGETYKKEKIECNVCGMVILDPNNRTFGQKIKGLFFDTWWYSGIKQFLTND